MMVVLISRGGYVTVTARYDRASIAHEDLFAECLQRGFNEVLALAGEDPPRQVVRVSSPAGDDFSDDESEADIPNGSVAFS
jgi:diacylglycerol O-acyltransferase